MRPVGRPAKRETRRGTAKAVPRFVVMGERGYALRWGRALTGETQKQMFQKRKTFRLAALKRIAEMGVPAGNHVPTRKKLYSIFLEKLWDSKGQSPWSPAAAGEIPLLTKKRRNSLKNPRMGFFKWPDGPFAKERTFSGQQSSELLATEKLPGLPLSESPSRFPDVPGDGIAGVGLVRKESCPLRRALFIINSQLLRS